MKETLKKHWGYDTFRPMQEEIITSLLAGRDTLAILPTGGGKSVCFQVPAMMREGICLVVSPLIALMKDQVQNLDRRGIKALAIYSGMTRREIDIALDNAVFGDYKFLYVSPERLHTGLFKTRVARMNVNFLVVDEAHCISQWGYDFRPDYLEIAGIRDIIGREVPVAALTATATPDVALDIMKQLQFRQENLIKGNFERPNLAYVVRKCEDKMGQVLRICCGVQGSGVVYVSKRKNAEDLAAFLKAHGVSAEAYHAGMSRDTRSRAQDSWKSGGTRVIVSTNAFGMGIDKADVRFVCHYDMPDTIEGYFQEAGRAGRDGQQSYAVLLWNNTDVKSLRQILKTSYPPLDYIKDIYQKVYSFLGYSYEEGKGACVKFELEKFAGMFKLHALSAYYAVKYIETAGYWTLTESIHIPARIQFIVSRDELYRIQLGSADIDTFIKVLLRMYTGIFTEYVAIDVERIARFGGYATEVVTDRIRKLAGMNVIKYIPVIDSPMISLNYERLDPKNLRLPRSDYDRRLSRRRDRLEKMIGYVEQTDLCRSRYLLKYFGQEKSVDCRQCDICREK